MIIIVSRFYGSFHFKIPHEPGSYLNEKQLLETIFLYGFNKVVNGKTRVHLATSKKTPKNLFIDCNNVICSVQHCQIVTLFTSW